MQKRILAFLLSFCLLSILLPGFCAHGKEEACFNFVVEDKDYCGGDLVKLQILANGMEPATAGFRVQMDYDDTRFRFARTETSDQIESKTFRFAENSNPVCGVYVCNTDQNKAPILSGNILTFIFEVKEGAAAGEGKLHVWIDQICYWDSSIEQGECAQDFSLNILPQNSNKASLSALQPSAGTLEPAFSSDITEYELDVPSQIKEVIFTADALDGGRVQVNRKTLKSAGTTTPVTITVVSANGKTRARYTVNVNRAEATESAQDSVYISDISPSSGKLSPKFSSNVTEYTLHVVSGVSHVTFHTQSSGNTVNVSRQKLNRAGSSTDIFLTAVSSDGKSKKIYTVTVERAEPVQTSVSLKKAFLTKLVPLSGELVPLFASNLTQYELDVDASVKEITFDAAAGDGGTVRVSRKKLNKAGETTAIIITAVSADQKDKLAYTVMVNRGLEDTERAEETQNVFLSALKPNKGELMPAFSPEITAYHLPVGAEVSQISFDAFAGKGETVQVSRKRLNSAGKSTDILIAVTSADRKNKRVYTVTVDRSNKNESYVPKSTGKADRKKNNQGVHKIQEVTVSAQPKAGTRNIYVVGNQMTAYLTGVLSSAGCVFLGILLMWIKYHMDKKAK